MHSKFQMLNQCEYFKMAEATTFCFSKVKEVIVMQTTVSISTVYVLSLRKWSSCQSLRHPGEPVALYQCSKRQETERKRYI